ncbi:tetratricopeptide repeat protein [Roseiconus nitratireducens]|uniref:Tetratricopeptide repeat protein n=2 Tax=Roseiconus nitratireducens TaxID=2605748 RepID=A0A5M6CYW3_9BACT|nr:tetratricopeptide repeat protein [Roseiconus nitratireducens]
MVALVGCGDDTALVRKIQNQRQAKQQMVTQQDHLAEIFVLLRQYIDLEPEKAERQIAYHLNRWSESKPEPDAKVPELLDTVKGVMPPDQLTRRSGSLTFLPGDADHLRDCYLFNTLYNWVDTDQHDESLLTDWFKAQEKELGGETVAQLKTATRLFDWTVRNIALEADFDQTPAPPGPSFPLGMEFRGPGYRQTDYQTLIRGTGDGLQRAGVFTQLCRQAGIPAAVLASIDDSTGDLTPFCVGVLLGDQIYLFEPRLGIFVPGPGQEGIATLAQARRDPLVLRRLSIAGFDQFTYPIAKENAQQCAALFNVLPEAISPRMQQLQSGLTGNRRMNVYVDVDQLAADFDAVTGISSVRIWDVPYLAEVYRATCEAYAERDPQFAFWYKARWAMLDGDFDMADKLARGRWQHLTGQFSDDEQESIEGARTLYMQQRAPEFEIDDLRIDVDLQQSYGLRRDLGTGSEQWDQQLTQIQFLMRMGKRTATYWLSLLQADDGRLETAENWFSKRALDEEQQSYWEPSARYNLARVAEALGETDRAIELYKRVGEPQEHGNRVRARLLAKQAGQAEES